jgi:membrane protease YdiL (CAAX protease family)
MARTLGAGPETTTSGRMTPRLYVLIVVALVLSVAHHVDHVLRGDTGWPLAGGFNPFTASLVIYPLILTGLALSVLGTVGPRFWALVSLGGGLFVAAIHLGPVATDTIAGIPSQYESPVAGGLAVALLAALIGVLVGTFAYEVRLTTRQRPGDPQRPTVVRRAAAFTLLAYGFTWAWWIPLALEGTAIDFGQAAPRYVVGLVGPLVAALVVTAATDGGTAVRSLVARMVRWRVAPRWYLISVGGLLGLWLLAMVITVATGGSAPSLEEMGLVPGLPATSVLVVWLYAVLVNGLGEETGWRGFLQPLLQRSFRPLTAVVLVSVIWAAWHLPLLSALTSFEVISDPAMLPVFWFGLAALSVVLAWVYHRSGASVLIAALWHGTYNLAAGTAAAQQGANVVFTVFVFAWAGIIVWLQLRDQRAGRDGAAPLAAPIPLTDRNPQPPEQTATAEPYPPHLGAQFRPPRGGHPGS